MVSERQADGIERDPGQYFKRYNARSPEKGGARKGYGPHAGQTLSRSERAADLKELRGRWEITANTHLEQLGRSARIDMRSHAERGTGLVPEMKQLPSQWRGEGRENVIEFRQARSELVQAHEHVQRIVPDAKAEVISLEAERDRRAQAKQQIAGPMQGQQQGEQQKSGGEDSGLTEQTRQAAAAGIAHFRAQFEQAKRIEAGKKQALEGFQRFKAEQQAQQRQVELRQAEQARLQAEQQARQREAAEKLKQRQAREARKRERDGPDWSR
jgi:hypothetical protein